MGGFFLFWQLPLVMAGYSSTPLPKKLGLKPHTVLCLRDAPSNYLDLISPLAEGIIVKNSLSGHFDFIHLFVTELSYFTKELQRCKAHLKQHGMVWVSWPKKAAKIATDVDENKIRDFGLKIGLVDVKVCAVDVIWSGLKFVSPVNDRK